VWNLIKYEILGKKKYYWVFSLIVIGAYLLLALDYRNLIVGIDPFTASEFVFTICLLIFLSSIIAILIDNLRDISINDLNYLDFSLPIRSSYLFYKRIVIYILELIYISILSILLTFIVLKGVDHNFTHILFTYFFGDHGFISILELIFGFFEIFLLFSIFIVASKLPSEYKFLKYLSYGLTSILLILGDYIKNKLTQLFPYNLLHMPRFNYKATINNWYFSLNANELTINIAVVIFHILVILLASSVYIYFLNSKVEIRR